MSLAESFDNDSDGIMLGILAVPSWMTPSDFLDFVAPAVEGISHLRIIRYVQDQCLQRPHLLLYRDSAPNRSIVIMKFMNPADAAEFVEAYNGKAFNSMEVRDYIVAPCLIISAEKVSSSVARNMQCGTRSISGHRRRRCIVTIYCAIAISAGGHVRTAYMSCVSRTNGFCRDWFNNRSLLPHISLRMSEQVG